MITSFVIVTSTSGETKNLSIPFGPSDVQTVLDIYLAAVMLALDKTIYPEKIKSKSNKDFKDDALTLVASRIFTLGLPYCFSKSFFLFSFFYLFHIHSGMSQQYPPIDQNHMTSNCYAAITSNEGNGGGNGTSGELNGKSEFLEKHFLNYILIFEFDLAALTYLLLHFSHSFCSNCYERKVHSFCLQDNKKKRREKW